MNKTILHHTITAFAAISSVLAVTVHACLWDRDTLAAEAKGLPGITEIITGRFDRFPPLYYEMRLERVSGQLVYELDNLDLYDDAGVACDRRGRSDEAIGWMGRKFEAMDRLEAEGLDVGEHRYRYLANLGTFYIHRWLKSGADRGEMGDVERSRELIAAAIELNPDAHFGREQYQLMAIESLLLIGSNRPEMTSFLGVISPEARKITNYPNGILKDEGYLDAVEGISGLIELGSAWKSSQIHQALELALGDEGHGVLSMLAHLRVHELRAEKYALDSSNPQPTSLKDSVFSNFIDQYDLVSLHDGFYTEARAEADQWVVSRNQYVLERLEQGLHPDTHSEFWGAWKETSAPPKLPDRSIWPVVFTLAGTIAVFLLAVVLFVFIVRKIVKLARRVFTA